MPGRQSINVNRLTEANRFYETDEQRKKRKEAKYARHRMAIAAYINLRKQYISPYSKKYTDLIEKFPDVKPLFVQDLVKSKLWVNEYWKDLGFHLLQAHPIVGVFCHPMHPMTYFDRLLFFIAGFAMGINAAAYVAGCDKRCEDTCYLANNGHCDDGITYAGSWTNNTQCEWGYDCADCGVRYEKDVRTAFFWNVLMYPHEYILCVKTMPHPEGMMVPLAIAICIAVGLTILKELSFCRCFANDSRRTQRICFVISRIMMVGVMSMLYFLAIHTWTAFGVNWYMFAFNKTLAYFLSAGGAWFFFHALMYPGEKKKIEEMGIAEFHESRLCLKSFVHKTKKQVKAIQDVTEKHTKKVVNVTLKTTKAISRMSMMAGSELLKAAKIGGNVSGNVGSKLQRQVRGPSIRSGGIAEDYVGNGRSGRSQGFVMNIPEEDTL